MNTYLIELQHAPTEGLNSPTVLGYLVAQFDTEECAKKANLKLFPSPFFTELRTDDYRILWNASVPGCLARSVTTTGNVFTPNQCPWVDPKGYIQVEVDTTYTGGNYPGVGTMELIPRTLVGQIEYATADAWGQINHWNLYTLVSVYEPFELAASLWLGVDPINIISRNEDTTFDKEGEEIDEFDTDLS